MKHILSTGGPPQAAPQVDLDGLLSNLLAKGLIQTPASSAPFTSVTNQPSQGIPATDAPPAQKPAFNALVSALYTDMPMYSDKIKQVYNENLMLLHVTKSGTEYFAYLTLTH